MAAIDLAEEMGVPVEWFAISSGAKISRDSGTENMDWVARVLRRLITFTQAGGEVNVVVAGINVGAQPYWNAEATMLMHTRGILVMTPDSAMVLTGKQALDYSGGVSAEDNFGIGGFDRIMGPNGQAQYWAPDLAGACEVLFAHYAHTYVAPGERYPRRAATSRPRRPRRPRRIPTRRPARDFTTVGDIFSAGDEPRAQEGVRHPDADARRDRPGPRRRSSAGRRWPTPRPPSSTTRTSAATRSRCSASSRGRSPGTGFLPADGPDQWTAGTLFPLSSKKVARAINAASGNRPVVVLANLSGFDGSPESLRKRQLEYGAEIGRAVVNFDGPDRVLRRLPLPRRRLRGVLRGAERRHGGARRRGLLRLGDRRRAGGGRRVRRRRRRAHRGRPAGRGRSRSGWPPRQDAERARLRAELEDVRAAVRSEKLGEVAAEFDGIHSVERALRVGSVNAIIPARSVRPLLVAAVERGLARAEANSGAASR